jgi:hypothetical protein
MPSRSVIAGVAALLCALVAAPASASPPQKSTFEVHAAYTDTFECSFPLRVHLDGTFKNIDYERNGVLYKSISTPGGGGPFTVTYTAKGTTLRQQSEAYSVVLTYNPDGSVRTYTQRGPFDRFTVPGSGVVLLDAGITVFSEPDETLLFSGGHHQGVEGDFTAFCAAFGS